VKPGLPVIKLVLAETTIPSQFLPQHLYIPTLAFLSIKGGVLHVDVKIRDPESDDWELDDPTVRSKTFDIGKDQILGIVIGGTRSRGGYNRYPRVQLVIRDPLGIVESLSLTFASTDANNPTYCIKAFAKILTDQFGEFGMPGTVHLPHQQTQPSPDEDDIPF